MYTDFKNVHFTLVKSATKNSCAQENRFLWDLTNFFYLQNRFLTATFLEALLKISNLQGADDKLGQILWQHSKQ